MQSDTVRTESDLLVPTTAVRRRRRALPAATFKRLRTIFTELERESLAMLIACRDCNQQVSVELVDQLDMSKPGGRMVLRCACTEREIR
jgi:hypothetical protein